MNTHMNTHTDSHEDTYNKDQREFTRSHEVLGVWKAEDIKLEKLGKLDWEADRPQMMSQ